MAYQQDLITLSYNDIIVDLNIGKGMCLIAAFFNSLPRERKTSAEVLQDIKCAMVFLIDHVNVSFIVYVNKIDHVNKPV